MALRMICARCGSEEVRSDTYADWSVDLQKWEVITEFDNKDCEVCGGETYVNSIDADDRWPCVVEDKDTRRKYWGVVQHGENEIARSAQWYDTVAEAYREAQRLDDETD